MEDFPSVPGSATYLGLDLGGSFLKAASFSPDGRWGERRSLDARGCREAEDYLALLREAAESLLQGRRARGVGVAVAGVLDVEAGRVVDSPNLPALGGVDLLALLKDAFSPLPVHMMNDANAAALGEYFAGAGAGCRSMFILTLGTGVGGGFIQDGEIWRGASGMAGEVGHMIIEQNGKPCACGARGCLEAHFSGWALARDARAHAAQHPDSAIASLDAISPVALSELAGAGDHAAKLLWENGGHALGTGIANVMNLLNPERVVLTGGLANARAHFWPTAQRAWEESAFERAHRSSQVLWGTLGEWAGARGAVQHFL